MFTREQIWLRLNAVLAEVFQLDRIELKEETTAPDVPGWDSVSHIRAMVAIEQAFGIRFRTGELAMLKNLGQLVDRIAAQSAGVR
jgi:acyl carrier protein